VQITINQGLSKLLSPGTNWFHVEHKSLIPRKKHIYYQGRTVCSEEALLIMTLQVLFGIQKKENTDHLTGKSTRLFFNEESNLTENLKPGIIHSLYREGIREVLLII